LRAFSPWIVDLSDDSNRQCVYAMLSLIINRPEVETDRAVVTWITVNIVLCCHLSVWITAHNMTPVDTAEQCREDWLSVASVVNHTIGGVTRGGGAGDGPPRMTPSRG